MINRMSLFECSNIGHSKNETSVSLVVAGLGLAGRIGIGCDFRVV